MTTKGADDSDARIRRHRARFDELLARSEASERRGRYDDAARLLQVAAALAWFSPTGLFVSPRLEAAAIRIGIATIATIPHDRPVQDRQRVLHVLTKAQAIGGHTRLAATRSRPT